jgi:lipoyl(octanoyl) transferase 2
MRTCARLDVPNTTTTEDPGVWISEPDTPTKATNRKLCALGVQIRRGITGHGIGLNVHDHAAPPPYTNTPISGTTTSPGYLTWGFSRIVACGLGGKIVTWLAREGADPDLRVEQVARVFAEEFAGALGLGMGEGNKSGIGAVRDITLRDIEGWRDGPR